MRAETIPTIITRIIAHIAEYSTSNFALVIAINEQGNVRNVINKVNTNIKLFILWHHQLWVSESIIKNIFLIELCSTI